MPIQGTPSWMIKLENEQMKQQEPAFFHAWLINHAANFGVPDNVITAQLDRTGYVKPIAHIPVPQSLPVKKQKGRPRKVTT
jgi:hypothetical protein